MDRSNPKDMFKIVKEDFNWIKEDIEEHRELIKAKLIELISNDAYDGFDDYKQKTQDLTKIIEKIDEIRDEYISIVRGEELDKKVYDDKYDYLDNWTGTNPKEILLFGQTYVVHYWREILLILIEELFKIDKGIVLDIVKDEDFRSYSRIPFTYEHDKVNKKLYKKTSFGLFVLVNDNANTIYDRCIKVLELSNYSEKDLKIKLDTSIKDVDIQSISIIDHNLNKNIKLPKKYASISINKSIFKTIVKSIVNRKIEYGTNYVEPRKIVNKYDELILDNTKYTTSYHVVINVIKYLLGIHFMDNYEGTKKGKYIVVDDDSLKSWVENNI